MMQSMKPPPVHFDDDWDDEPCPDHCEDKVPLGKYYYCDACGREWFEIDEGDDAQKEPDE